MFSLKQTTTIAAITMLAVFNVSAQKPEPAPSSQVPVATAPEKDTIRRPTSSTTGSSMEKVNYVRRFSIAASLSVLALDTMKDNTTGQVNNQIDAIYATTVQSKRIGYGATGQIAITNHLAISAGIFIRKASYAMNSDVFTGTDNILTLIDERKHTITNETTTARFYDIPVTVRYFVKGRQEKGAHLFLEAGGVIRKVSGISSSIDSTINAGTTTCCVTTPITPHKKNTNGLVGGVGVHLVDPLGIRLIPSVRYTYFLDSPFNTFSTKNKRNQIEAIITIGF